MATDKIVFGTDGWRAVIAVEHRLAEVDGPAGHELDVDRRRPAAVGRRRGRRRLGDRIGLPRHAQVPCCQLVTYSSCSGVMSSSVMPIAASLSRATSASIASGTT